MTKRDCVIEVLKGGRPPYIPSFGECPMDVTVVQDLLPPSTGDFVTDAIQFADFFDNSVTDVGIGIASKTLSRDESHHTYEYETGAVWKEKYQPTFCREAERYPVNTPEEALRFRMPPLDDGRRFDRKRLADDVRRLKAAGYFVQGGVIGAWASCYYYFTRFETILEWMLVEPEAAAHLFKAATDFSLQSAEILLECGVDCIFSISDMGTAISTLFSPAMFRQYVFPWLAAMSKLCHQHGAWFHLHSHGHIETLMDGIVEAGVDLVNPVGPSDYNDLEMFKANWGGKISMMGGVSTTIAGMTEEEMRAHVHKVIETGRQGGRFFPRTESGIPPMSREKTMLYLEILKQERMRGYCD